jgi:hypothetical protein
MGEAPLQKEVSSICSIVLMPVATLVLCFSNSQVCVCARRKLVLFVPLSCYLAYLAHVLVTVKVLLCPRKEVTVKFLLCVAFCSYQLTVTTT